MNEKELKELEELRERNPLHPYNRIDKLLADNAKLREDIIMWSDMNREHAKRERFLDARLRRIMHMLALDTVLQRTHRERNDVLRTIVNLIVSWLNEPITDNTDMDDIPY